MSGVHALGAAANDRGPPPAPGAPNASLLTKISAIWMTRVIAFAVTSGLLDALDAGLLRSADLAEALNLRHDPIERILQALAQLDLVREAHDGFGLTEDGRRLTSSAPGSLAPLATLWNGSFDAAWSKLAETARTGRSGFELALGRPLFEHLAHYPDEARTFDGAMRSLIGLEAPAAAAVIAASQPSKICDVGGGDGALLEAILVRSPNTNAILFDRGDVIAGARSRGLLPPSIALRSGDFFEHVPDAPAHVLANILHDWNDHDAGRILRAVAAAQPSEGIIYVIEPILGGPNEPTMARAFDLHMMMLAGGRERHVADLALLLAPVGYEIERVETLGDLYRILRARRRS